MKFNIDLVKVYDTWRNPDDGLFYVLMEYLGGYKRLEYANQDDRIHTIESNLMRQGLFVFDFSPINFMVKDGNIKMIDLDTLARIDDFPFDANYLIKELSWYGSRVLKQKRNSNG